MKLLQLKAKDFRSLKDLEINFPDEQVIAIIGNNGSGKTAVLDAIEICLLNILSLILKKPYTLPFDDMASELAKINLTYNLNTKEISSIASAKNYEVIPYSDELPTFMYYPSPRNYEVDTVLHRSGSRKYVDSFGFRINKLAGEDFKEWFIAETQRENEEIKRRKDFEFTLDSLNNIRLAINTFFTHLEDDRFDSIFVKTTEPEKLDFKDKPKPDVYVKKKSFELKLSQLSAGEKMLIYIVADIAKRLVIFNKAKALKGEHLVLIDEIDLHLHPSWQKSVAKALSATFPNVQFVITTHSPLILNQLKTESILILEDGKCTPLSEKYQSFNSYGADLEDILKIVQGTDNLIPKDIQQKLDEINAKLNEGAIEDAKNLIANLKTLTDPNQPELKKAETQIQYKELLR